MQVVRVIRSGIAAFVDATDVDRTIPIARLLAQYPFGGVEQVRVRFVQLLAIPAAQTVCAVVPVVQAMDVFHPQPYERVGLQIVAQFDGNARIRRADWISGRGHDWLRFDGGERMRSLV